MRLLNSSQFYIRFISVRRKHREKSSNRSENNTLTYILKYYYTTDKKNVIFRKSFNIVQQSRDDKFILYKITFKNIG